MPLISFFIWCPFVFSLLCTHLDRNKDDIVIKKPMFSCHASLLMTKLYHEYQWKGRFPASIYLKNYALLNERVININHSRRVRGQ